MPGDNPTDIDNASWPKVPERLIAKHPSRPRDAARLLCCDATGTLYDKHVRDLTQLIKPNDVIVYNDCRVIPARIFATRVRDGVSKDRRFEIVLLEETKPDTWQALVRPRRHLQIGDRLICNDNIHLDVTRMLPGRAEVTFSYPLAWSFDQALENCGQTPIPPYLKRTVKLQDKDDYQTIFAQVPGAVAAPTAGLHFSHDLFAKLTSMNVRLCPLTLLVSGATFLPHRRHSNDPVTELHRERFSIPHQSWQTIQQAKIDNDRVIAIGTTTLRALESTAPTLFSPDTWHETRLYIRQPFTFRLVNVLMTNFHTAESSLIEIVKCFIGPDTAHNMYAHAIDQSYRFYSYGDACWLEHLELNDKTD